MKITDRFKDIMEIESTHWDNRNNRLVIYYYRDTDMNTLKVRVADAIGKANLQGAFETKLMSL